MYSENTTTREVLWATSTVTGKIQSTINCTNKIEGENNATMIQHQNMLLHLLSFQHRRDALQAFAVHFVGQFTNCAKCMPPFGV